MPQATGTDGLSPDSYSLRQTVHKRFSALGCVSEAEPISALPGEGERDLSGSLGTVPVESTNLSDSRGTHGHGSS